MTLVWLKVFLVYAAYACVSVHANLNYHGRLPPHFQRDRRAASVRNPSPASQFESTTLVEDTPPPAAIPTWGNPWSAATSRGRSIGSWTPSTTKTSWPTTKTSTSTSNSITGCTSVLPTVAPLLTVPAIGTSLPPFSIFADLEGPDANVTTLKALEVSDSTTGTYFVIPNQNGTGFSVVLSGGQVIVANDGFNPGSPATKLSTPACSSNSSLSKRGLGKVEAESFVGRQPLPRLLDSRQAAGGGGAAVILDVVNTCGQPVPGSQLSPLLLFCAVAENQDPLFPYPGLSYAGGSLQEGPTGHFTGFCPFPPAMTCSSIIDQISAVCNFAPLAKVSAPAICAGLEIPLEGLPIYEECVGVFTSFGTFCTNFGKLAKPATVASFCSLIHFPPPPTSVEIQITVEGEGNDQFTLSNAAEIENTGGAIQENFSTQTVDGSCTPSVSPYTCAPTAPPSSTTTSTTTTPGGACSAVPTIVDGGFEDGQQALANYEFPAGGTFNVVCGGANGLDAACGNCFGQNFGGGEISTYFQACPGSTYTFSAAVAMEPGSTGSCTVQMYLYEVGTANSSPAQTIPQGWGGVSFTFTVPTDVTCCSTNVVLNFVCTNLEPENGSTPWVGFDNFVISG